jgi:DNA-binding response OmpR family regulator
MNGKGAVVVVETDDLIRGLLDRWLGEAGYAVVGRSEEGAKALKATRPVLVIVNVSDPRGAPALIRSLQAVYAVPVLAMSGRFRRGLGASTDAARRLGVQRVLPKPFTRKELLWAVKASVEGPS